VVLAVTVVTTQSAAASTVERTLRPEGARDGMRLVVHAGERHLVRRAPRVQASARRSERRRSLAYFAHLTDLHIADEASPARHERLYRRSRAYGGFWRPQESFAPHVVDAAVRAVNAHASSPLATAGGPARLGFALVTGDLADNAQANEVRLAVRTLDGGRVDPFSGRRISRRSGCSAARRVIRRLNGAVEARRYAGVRAPGFPNMARRWPGALDRAQQPFVAQGLHVPWYSVRGNHDALPQGHYGPADVRPRSAPLGCRKVFAPPGQASADGAEPWPLLRRSLPRGRFVPPDGRRRFLRSAPEFRRLHGRGDSAHGFGLTAVGERRNSRGHALYYAFSPRPGLRFIALDTTADAGGAGGNVDHPQYRWLRRELRRAQRRRELTVVYGHHPLEMMANAKPDELAARFDRDPRSSQPLHLGRSGRASLRSLLLRHTNVVLYVTGHKHYDRIWPNFRRDGRGFWQVVTGSLAGAPQQARLLELIDNADGTLSIVTTMLDHQAPVAAPSPGSAGALSPGELASISRAVAWERRPVRAGRRATSTRAMRNTELVLRDPRRQAPR
jgi:metallophosphoesterase (TIGR03767 family)